jgi:hypothetical protein
LNLSELERVLSSSAKGCITPGLKQI